MNEKEEKIRYDLHKNSPEDKGYIDFLKRLVEPLSIKLKEGFKGLDFGCGPGPAIDVLLKGKGVSVANYDPFYFPDRNLLKNCYDFIVCTEVIEHFYDPRREFIRFNQLLKREGSFLAVMTREVPAEEKFADWWYHREPSHVCFYSHATFQWLAGWLGLRAEYPKENVVIFSKGSVPTLKEPTNELRESKVC